MDERIKTGKHRGNACFDDVTTIAFCSIEIDQQGRCGERKYLFVRERCARKATVFLANILFIICNIVTYGIIRNKKHRLESAGEKTSCRENMWVKHKTSGSQPTLRFNLLASCLFHAICGGSEDCRFFVLRRRE